MMDWIRNLLAVGHVDMAAAENEVFRRRDCAMKALAERKKRDPGFVVRPETVLDATADAETRTMIRKLAGVKDD